MCSFLFCQHTVSQNGLVIKNRGNKPKSSPSAYPFPTCQNCHCFKISSLPRREFSYGERLPGRENKSSLVCRAKYHRSSSSFSRRSSRIGSRHEQHHKWKAEEPDEVSHLRRNLAGSSGKPLIGAWASFLTATRWVTQPHHNQSPKSGTFLPHCGFSTCSKLINHQEPSYLVS